NACAIVVRAVKPPAAPLPPPATWPPASVAITHRETPTVSAVALTADDVLDGYGQPCGTLEPMMRTKMRALASGQVLEVRADDPHARLGVPAWSRLAEIGRAHV